MVRFHLPSLAPPWAKITGEYMRGYLICIGILALIALLSFQGNP